MGIKRRNRSASTDTRLIFARSFDEEKPGFFTQSISHAVVHFILERMRFSADDDTSNNVGIEKLLAEGTYEASYPLHDGDCRVENSHRHLLFTEWASVSKWIK